MTCAITLICKHSPIFLFSPIFSRHVHAEPNMFCLQDIKVHNFGYVPINRKPCKLLDHTHRERPKASTIYDFPSINRNESNIWFLFTSPFSHNLQSQLQFNLYKLVFTLLSLFFLFLSSFSSCFVFVEKNNLPIHQAYTFSLSFLHAIQLYVYGQLNWMWPFFALILLHDLARVSRGCRIGFPALCTMCVCVSCR